MAKSSANKVRNLRQTEEVWEVAVQPANTWIESPHGGVPYRPWYVFVISQDDKIIRHEFLPKKPTLHDISECTFRGMRRPMLGAGKKRRPAKILVDNDTLFNGFAPMLEKIGVACQIQATLPYSNAALDGLNAQLNKDDDFEKNALISIPGITIPLLGKVFEATAAYYRLAPWEMFPEEEFAIEIRYPADSEPRYGIVIGRAGESFGLSVNDTLDELRQFIREASSFTGSSGSYSVLSFTYEQAFHFAFKDLDAIEKYGWEVASENAYPNILRYNPSKGRRLLPAEKKDIFWLEGAIPALVEFFENKFDTDGFFSTFGEKEHESIIEVETLAGKQKVSIKLPVKVF